MQSIKPLILPARRAGTNASTLIKQSVIEHNVIVILKV